MHRLIRSSTFLACCVSLALLSSTTAFAAQDTYPSKPIKVVVPYGAGGSSDMAARLTMKEAEKHLGQRIAIVNTTGGGSAIGSMEVQKAAPDGYTLLWQQKSLITAHHTGAMAVNWDGFTPISNVLLFNEVLHVHKDNADLKTMDAIVAKAKAKPETLRFPAQLGTGSHFGALAVERATGAKFHITASGGDVDRLNEQLGKRAELVFQSIPPTLPHIKAGTLIPIAVGAEERDPELPDVPTFRELGYDIVTTFHLGLYGPKGLDPQIVKLWETTLATIMANPEITAELAKQSLHPAYMAQAAFIEHLTRLDKDLYQLAKIGGILAE